MKRIELRKVFLVITFTTFIILSIYQFLFRCLELRNFLNCNAGISIKGRADISCCPNYLIGKELSFFSITYAFGLNSVFILVCLLVCNLFNSLLPDTFLIILTVGCKTPIMYTKMDLGNVVIMPHPCFGANEVFVQL